jgi:geranylgeranyl reductase family protein
VVGAGPAGSIAALVLARAGASVTLVDKARFPRDKACGDVVGPKGLQVLDDLGVGEPAGLDVGDMVVVGPNGRQVVLPALDGRTYPGRARVVPRTVLDDALRTAALDAGALALGGRADRPLVDGDGEVEGFAVATARGEVEVRAGVVIGADGSTSHVAGVAGLVDPHRVLWGFAVRSYIVQDVALPAIVLWEPARFQAFPGYGWVFPGPGGVANVGLGIGTLAQRRAGAGAVQALPAYLERLVRLGLIDRVPASPPPRLGGWLKMGMVGTTPAAGRVLLVGDAAGLVNPLQGEGIAQAMTSGRAAADAVLGSPGTAARTYRRALAAAHLPYQRVTAAGHAAMVGRPRAVSLLSRVVTAPVVGPALAGGWGIFWNELLDGAVPGKSRTVASATTLVARAATSRTEVSRWFAETFEAQARPSL